MKWLKDTTGRFNMRPHYTQDELDSECEQVLNRFFDSRKSYLTFPITTEELTVLIEQSTEDFDSCTDLSHEGPDVEGVTYFADGRLPTVCISERLNEEMFHNRLRTTLTHELFHVVFHDNLYQVREPDLFETYRSSATKCKRENILAASSSDWMEWQAGYGCGAFLMPISALAAYVQSFRQKNRLEFTQISTSSDVGHDLIASVAEAFTVSYDAARVRLSQKKVVI